LEGFGDGFLLLVKESSELVVKCGNLLVQPFVPRMWSFVLRVAESWLQAAMTQLLVLWRT
jgi:hypothetical protein